MGGQNRFSKNLMFERFAANFFSSLKEVQQGAKRYSANLSCNAFFHRDFSSRYIMVRGRGHEGVE